MSTDWDEPEKADAEEDDTDTGFAGGGGPAATIYGEDDTLDERGDDLVQVDEDQL